MAARALTRACGAALALLLAVLPAPRAVAEVRATDAAGRTLLLAQPATRIVALAPHLAENLHAAGAGDRLVAVSRHSDWPPAVRALPVVGDAQTVNLESLLALRPSLVLAWASGTRPELLARLERLRIPVYLSEPGTPEGIAAELRALGTLAGTAARAEAAAAALEQAFAALSAATPAQAPRVLLQIEPVPLLSLGDTHFAGALVRRCGGHNIAGGRQLVPALSVEAVLAARPDLIVRAGADAARWPVPSAWQALPAAQPGRILLIDPDLLLRPTPRLLDGARALCAGIRAAAGT